jgi:hypothetical protein
LSHFCRLADHDIPGKQAGGACKQKIRLIKCIHRKVLLASEDWSVGFACHHVAVELASEMSVQLDIRESLALKE